MTRRALGCVVATLLALWLDADVATAVPTLEAHVLERTAFGPDTWSEQRIAQLGVNAYLEEQLHPQSIPDGVVAARLAHFSSLQFDFQDLIAEYADLPNQPLAELMRARLLRSAFSHRQLEQVLVDFWFDHFNVYVGAGRQVSFSLGPYERDAIRPHVLGRFRTLLVSVAHSAAMLYYLDNFISVQTGYLGGGLNENFARELLELHTVGVEAGYTQRDVIDVARAFTGWSAYAPPEGGRDGFFFYSESHDRGAKRIMDLSLPAGRGMEEGFDVIAYLAAHPSTARRICRALIVRFVSESVPTRLLDECAQVFRTTDGNLESVMRTLLFSAEFRDPSQRGKKLKRPAVFVASLLRATGADPSDAVIDQLLRDLMHLGEAPYFAHPPSGYPDGSEHWAGSGALIARFKLITHITDAEDSLHIDWGVGSGSASQIVDALAPHLLGTAPTPATRAAVIRRIEELGSVSDSLRVREAAALLLASPDFLQH